MKKRGFTLIELLAVIIILTILTFIVIFFVDPMLNDSEEKNIELSVKNYIRAIENNVLSSRLEDINVQDGSYSVMPNGDLCLGQYSNQICDGKVLQLELKEGNPVSGTVFIENKTVVAGVDVNINNKVVSWGNEGSVIVQGTTQKPVITIKDTNSFSDNILINYIVESEIGIKEYSCVYGNDETYGNVGVATSRSCKLDNLTENEIYYYKIIVTDSKGNEAYAIGSLKASDIVAPEIAITPSGYSMSKVALITYNDIKITSPEYYFYSTIDGQSDIEVYNCGVDSSKPLTCSEISTTTLEKNTWYRTTSTKVNVTYKDNGTLIARTSDGTNYKSSTQALITGVDKYAPEIVLNSITNSTNSIVINYTATDDQAIKSYSCEYGLDKNYDRKANITENNCVINNLKQDTKYYYKITVIDVVGRKTIKEGSSVTSDIQTPIIAITPSGWAKTKVAKITYDNTNITLPEYYFYSTITGEVDTEVSSCGTNSKIPGNCSGETTTITSGTWYKTTSNEISITTNVTGSIIARTSDGNNYKASAQGAITMIDNTIPENIVLNSNSDIKYEKNKSVNVTLSDTLSGLTLNNTFKYGWSKSLDKQPSKYETITPSYTEGITKAIFDVTGENLTGDYYLWIVPTKYVDMVGNANITTVKSTGTFKFDNEAPIIDIESVVNNDNDLVISYTLTDEQSGVESFSCEYGTDTTYGNTASATSTGCTINNVDSRQTYYYKITSTDKLGNAGFITGSTSAAIISVTPSGWAKSKTANIKYIDTGIEGIEYYFYSTVDTVSDKNVSDCGTDSSAPSTCSGATTSISANTWYKTTELEINLTYNKQGMLIARMSDSNGYKSSAQAAITKIDTIEPAINTVTASNEWGTIEKIMITATDNNGGSGVVEYMLTTTATMPDENSSEWQTSNEFEVSNNTTWYAWAKDAVGNISAYKTVTNSHVCYGIWDVSKAQDETVHGILKLDGTFLVTGKGETYSYTNTTDRPYHSLSSKIKNVVIEEGVTSLGSRFFQQIETIKTINIPSTLKTITNTSLYLSTNINADGITIASGNTSFVFENSALYDVNKTRVYLHSRNDNASEYTIPSTLKTVLNGAFYRNTNIKTLNVSSNFNIEWNAFNGCTNLTTINSTAGNTTINGTLGNVSISGNAFKGTKLNNVKLSKNLTVVNKSGTTYYEPFTTGIGTIYYYGSNSVVVDYIENTDDTLTWKAIATVTLNPNGGSVSKTEIEAVYEETYGSHDTLPTPEREGYTFVGWYTEAGGGTKITDSSSTLKSTDHTLYARWQKTASALEVTLNPTSYTYDGTAKKPTVTVKDGSTTLVKDTDYTVAYSNNTNAGTATVTITAKGVYNSTSQATYAGTTSKTFTINKKQLTVANFAYSPITKVYDGTTNVPSEFKVTPAGVVSGDTVTISYTSAAYNNANVASATSIAVSGMALGGTSSGNYSLDATSYTKTGATITKASSTNPTLTAYEGTYDGESHTFTLNGGIGGTIEYSTDGGTTWAATKPSRTNVGTTTVHVRILGDSNHNNTTATSTTIKINAKSVTVTAASASKTYDGIDLTKTSGCSSAETLVSGHEATCTNTGTITNVGSVTNTLSTVVIKDAIGTDVTANYSITKKNGTLTVEPAPLLGGSVKITGNSIYGDTLTATVTNTDPTASYTYQWWTSTSPTSTTGEPISGAKSKTYQPTSVSFGKYVGVTVTATKDNYITKDFSDITDEQTNTTGTIAARKVIVTAGNASKTYDGTVLTSSTCTASNLAFAHTLKSCTMTNDSAITNAGSISNKVSDVTLSAGKPYYEFEYVDGTLTVNKKNVAVVWSPDKLSASGDVNGDGVVDETDYDLVDQYIIELTDDIIVQNADVNGDGKIDSADASLISRYINQTYSYVYDGEAKGPTASAISGVTGEIINVTRTTGINAGDYTSTASCLSVSGGQAECNNYTLTDITMNFVIEKATPTLIFNDSSGTVDALSTSTFTATPNTISACSGTLTATSEDTSYVTVTGGALTDNVASGTNITITYKGESYSTAIPILVSYVPTDTANCNSVGKVFIVSVSRVNPSLTLEAKTATYTGKVISANVPKITYNNSIVNLNCTYEYYTNSSCTTQTTTATGASATGGAPVNAGTYYVKATSTQTDIFNAVSSACTLHKINKANPVMKFYNSADTMEISELDLELSISLNYLVFVSAAGTLSYTNGDYSSTHVNGPSSALNVTAGQKLSVGTVGSKLTSTPSYVSWTLTPTDTTNYNTVTKSLTVNQVTKIKPKIYAYSDSAGTIPLTKLDLIYSQNTNYYLKSNVAGTFTFNDSGGPSTHVNGPNTASGSVSANGLLSVGSVGTTITDNANVTWTFTPTTTALYETVTLKIPVNISGKNSAKVGSCNSLTYTGSAQTLVSGGLYITYTNNSGTNVGSYTVTMTPYTGYTWSDETTTAKTLTCKINKATPTLYIDDANANKTYNYITYNRSGNGFDVKSSVAGTIATTTSNSSLVSITSNASISAAKNTSYTVGIKGADVTSTQTTLTVKLTPTDTTNYNTATKYVYVNKVQKETPTLTASASSGSVVKGSSKTYTIKANVAGKFTITKSPNATYASASINSTAATSANTNRTITYKGLEYTGTDTTIVVTFTPTDTTHYNTTTHTFTITQVGETTNVAPTMYFSMATRHISGALTTSAKTTEYTPMVVLSDAVSGFIPYSSMTVYFAASNKQSCNDVISSLWSATATVNPLMMGTKAIQLVGDTKVSSGGNIHTDTATACVRSLCDMAGNCASESNRLVTTTFERYR